jgi:hypothetical protein
VRLLLDHLILRSADAARDLDALAAAGLPLRVPLKPLTGTMRSGLLGAGAIDVEVLEFEHEPPARLEGYGLGVRAPDEADLWAVARELRARGLATSMPIRARTGEGAAALTWGTVQVSGLLPEPFPVPFSQRAPGRAEHAMAALGGRLAKLGFVARAATRRPGRSMVVVTAYGFDVEAARAAAPAGPEVVEVEVGVGDAAGAWAGLGPIEGPSLVLRSDGPTGIRRIVLSGHGWDAGRELVLGDVVLQGR